MGGIICAGHVNWDVTLRVDALPAPDGEAVITDQSQSGGGSASNVASVLADLGHQPTLLGSHGDDGYGRLLRQELTDAGVDCSPLQSVTGETTVKYLVVDEDGEVFVLANDGTNESYTATDLPDTALDTAAWLHLTSQQPETAERLRERARTAGIPVSFDPGRRLRSRRYGPLLRSVDLLFLNEREAEAADESGVLSERADPTVIKYGNGGAEYREGDRRITHDGFDVQTVDTAGAGDAFAGGFLGARCDGYSPETALAIGNACGAIAVQSIGARTSLSWEIIQSYWSPSDDAQ